MMSHIKIELDDTFFFLGTLCVLEKNNFKVGTFLPTVASATLWNSMMNLTIIVSSCKPLYMKSDPTVKC